MPDALLRLDAPGRESAEWLLDATRGEHAVHVQWTPVLGFGITSSRFEEGYGQRPEEVCATFDEARDRVLHLLRTGGRTSPPPAVVLRELRRLAGATQTQLAMRLGVGQAAVSKLERSREMSLRALERYVQALGGERDIRVRLGGEEFTLASGRTERRAADEPARTSAAAAATTSAATTTSAAAVAEAAAENDAEVAAAAPPHRDAPEASSDRLSLLVLRSADIDRARRFYAALGLRWKAEKHGNGSAHFAAEIGGSVVEIYPATRNAPPARVRLGLRIRSARTAVDILVRSGLCDTYEARLEADRQVFFVRDPDGNSVVVEEAG